MLTLTLAETRDVDNDRGVFPSTFLKEMEVTHVC
jgi:hypothetical protein